MVNKPMECYRRGMVKRGWLVFSAVWAAAFLANGATKAGGIQDFDLFLASLPFVVGWSLWRALRYVISGR